MGFSIGVEELKTKNLWIAVLAEFHGCMLFLICVVSVALGWGSSDVSANNVEIGIGIGLAIASLAQAFGHVSGGHLNPAVTLGTVIAGRISVLRGLLYVIGQVLGGVAGSGIIYACTPESARGGFGVTSLGKDVTPGQGFALELLFTFFLVFFVLSITDDKKNTEPYGTTLGIGVMILVAHVCLIPFTGCGINPARAFGPSVIMGKFDNHWIYWIGPFLGAILAAIEYVFVFGVPKETTESKEEAIPLNEETA